MKFLRDRKEIAKYINIDRVPVMTVDITKPMEGYPDCYKGTKINIEGCHSGRYADLLTHCTVMMFGDEKGNEDHETPWKYERILLRPRNACLQADFTLRDVDEMIEWMSAPMVKKGDKVIVFFRGEKEGYLRVMRIPEKVYPDCSTACELEDVD